ncbi:hypothetical protein L484_008292 [Morus notabilis]|uniref:Uncharacterized protein n=1 Tax=Morus notabilis TaxID=981085 RepID=W9R091_9ROSA|nr:hypothetical protein L484_008292 [Morus notabilis]
MNVITNSNQSKQRKGRTITDDNEKAFNREMIINSGNNQERSGIDREGRSIIITIIKPTCIGIKLGLNGPKVKREMKEENCKT